MTIKEFEQHNKNHDMPFDWMGQGSGYKSNWDMDNPNDIIYIPEYAYIESEKENTVDREKAYSAQDFINLCNGNVEMAKDLFDSVDWQYPEGVMDEDWFKEGWKE